MSWTKNNVVWKTFPEYSEGIFQVKQGLLGLQVGPYLESLLPVFSGSLEPDQDPALRISFLQVYPKFETSNLTNVFSYRICLLSFLYVITASHVCEGG
jgi:hypothetical protein